MNPDLDPDPELDFQLFGKSGSVFRSSKTWDHNTYTEKCRFMDKRVREISRFFVAPRREFAPAVWRVSRTLLSRNTSTSVVKTLPTFCDIEYRICSCLTKLFNNYQLPLSVEIRLPRWRSKSCAAISLTLCGTCRRGRRRLRRRRPHRLTSRTQLVSTAIASPPAAATSTCMPLRSLGIMLI